MPTAADTRTAPGVDRRPLISYLRVQRDQDRRMIAILRRTSTRIDDELRRLEARAGIGAAVRRDQLRLTQVELHRELAELWRQLGLQILAGREEAAAAAIESIYPPTLLRSVFPAADVDYLLRSAKTQAASTIEVVEARLKISRIPLARSVYKSEQLVSGQVDAIVDEALARGASARELAKDVRRFVNPNVRGGVRYAAMRLGRTELNNAFHATQVQSGITTPWTHGLRWNLSGSHPRPDECNEYAEHGGTGVWDPKEVPAKPHPNCLCFMTPEVDDRATFIDRYVAGDFDNFVDSMMRSGGITIR